MDGLRIQREWTKGDKGVVRRVRGVQGDYVWDGEKVVDLWRENQPISSGIRWGRRAVFLFTLCAAVCLSLYCWNLIVSTEKHQPFLLKKVSEVTQSCPTLCDPMDYSLPGSSVHGIFQARVLEWVAIAFSRRSSQTRDWTWVSRIVSRCFTTLAIREEFPFPLKSRIIKFSPLIQRRIK